MKSKLIYLASIFAFAMVLTPKFYAQKTNVIIIMPDDLSFGDYSYYNQKANAPQTPNIDNLGKEALRLTDFHVAPTCSPSRSQLMTGRYDDEVGAWHTVMGRYFLRTNEVTMAEVFKANGYETALFGKWHLGETYPFRPKDRGFDHAVMIQGGGIDQQPDFWGNRNTMPCTLFINGRPEELSLENGSIPGEKDSGAFATNFFTTQAIDYMKEKNEKKKSFFVYLPYNVAHGPQDMPPDARPGVSDKTATIENMDKNVGRIMKFLDSSGLAKNTLLVFILGDNGMGNFMYRGGKGSEYEAGHRVPCFVRWPQGGYAGTPKTARDVSAMTTEMDLLPTFMDVLKLHDVANRPSEVAMVGHSIKTLLDLNPANDNPVFGSRVLVVDNQRMDDLIKYKQASVMQDELNSKGQIIHKWRLMKPEEKQPWELYDILVDEQQVTNLLTQPNKISFEKITKALQTAYEEWWTKIIVHAADYARPIAGSPNEPEICLFSHDWHMSDGLPPWNQTAVTEGLNANGFNVFECAKAGNYTFDLRRWPKEIANETTVTSVLKSPIRSEKKSELIYGKALPIHSIRIRIWNGDKIYLDTHKDVDPNSDGAVFSQPMPAGPAMVQSWFYDADGKDLGGAYYDYISLEKSIKQ